MEQSVARQAMERFGVSLSPAVHRHGGREAEPICSDKRAARTKIVSGKHRFDDEKGAEPPGPFSFDKAYGELELLAPQKYLQMDSRRSVES